ncbi:MAG: tetratricopeptide repeat protein [Myxococcota bacterium]
MHVQSVGSDGVVRGSDASDARIEKKTCRTPGRLAALYWMKWGLSLATFVQMVLSSSPSQAQSMEEIFQAGNQAFFDKRYEDAQAAYQELIDSGLRDPNIEFNLGATLASLEQYGRAIAHFERALSLQPGDREALRDLRHARHALSERGLHRKAPSPSDSAEAQSVNEESSSSAVDADFVMDSGGDSVHAITRGMHPDALGLSLLLLSWLATAALIGGRYAARPSVRLGLTIGGILSVLTASASGILLLLRIGFFDPGMRAIVAEATITRNAPDPRAEQQATVSEGKLVYLAQERGGFYQLIAEDQEVGWAPTAQVVAIQR